MIQANNDTALCYRASYTSMQLPEVTMLTFYE